MKIIFNSLRNLQPSISRVLHIGLKICFLLLLFSTFILSLYTSIHNFNLFYLGINLFKTSLFYISFLYICAIGINTIKKGA